MRVKLPADLGGGGGGGGRAAGSDDEGGQCVAADAGRSSAEDLATGCKIDDDCVRVEQGCCHLGKFIPVIKAKSAGYQAGLSCVGVVCPQVVIADDHSVAQCNGGTHKCELVLPKDVACDGFTTNPHACPEGWHCRVPGHIADEPGSCLQICGGFAGIQCSEPGAQCIDDPSDDCDPQSGGADCGGLCLPPPP